MPDDRRGEAHARHVARQAVRAREGNGGKGQGKPAGAQDPPPKDAGPAVDLRCGDRLEAWNDTRRFDFGQAAYA